MQKFVFDFTHAPEPRRIKLAIPEILATWFEKEAVSHGGTMEAGIVQALQFVRSSQEEPANPRKRIRKSNQTPRTLQEI
jgi:hypothetical protein